MTPLAVLLLGLLLAGCSSFSGGAPADSLTPATLIKLSRLQGRLEAKLGPPCQAGKIAGTVCADLDAASKAFDAIATSQTPPTPFQVQQLLDLLLKVAGTGLVPGLGSIRP